LTQESLADFAVDNKSFIVDQPGAKITKAQLAEVESSLGQPVSF
jgi:hypothetical protein